MSSPRTGRIGTISGPVSAPRGHALRLVIAARMLLVRRPEITIGVLGVLAACAFSWVPSLWYDESATVTSATRPWRALWAELHNVDAVHGLYYALMHVWFDLVGYTPLSLRFPSAFAIGVAAGAIVALGRHLVSTKLGVVAGIVFLLLPRVAWAGTEGRPYAAITAISVILALVGLTATRHTRTHDHAARWWGAYGAIAVFAVVFNVYLSLAVAAHGVVLLWTLLAERRDAAVRRIDRRPPLVTKSSIIGWCSATAGAAIMVSPFVLVVISEARQVGWIEGIQWETFTKVFATAWFGRSFVYATVAWILIVLGVALPMSARSMTARGRKRRQLVRVSVPIVVLPSAVLIGATAAGVHLYSPKYASLSLPFVAMLIALALTGIRPMRLAAAAMVLLLLVSVPTSIAVRTPHAKQDTHWADAASIIEAHREEHRSRADGVIYGSVHNHPTTTTQVIADAYPGAFVGMRNLAIARSGAQDGTLWDANGQITSTVPPRLHGIDTVWFIGDTVRDVISSTVHTTLSSNGFHTVGSWKTGTVRVLEYARRS